MARRKSFLGEGCVAKRGHFICREDVSSEGADLVCDEHLRDMRKGDPVILRAGLKKEDLKTWAKLKSKGSRTQTETSSSDEDRLKALLLSVPSLFIILSSPVVLLLDQVWRNGLNIYLPAGSGASNAHSVLTPELVFPLFAFALIYIFGVLSVVIVVFLASVIVSTAKRYKIVRHSLSQILFVALSRLWIWGWLLSFWIMARWPSNHARIWSRENKNLKLLVLRQKVQARLDEFKAQSEEWEADIKSWMSKPKRFGKRALSTMFGGAPTTFNIAIARGIGILVAGLVVLYSVHSDALSVANALDEYSADHPKEYAAASEDEPPECKTIERSGLTTSLLYYLTNKLEGADIRTVGAICGRITFSRHYQMQASRLRDVTVEKDEHISREVFHLGRYGDWIALAPMDDTSKRIYLKSSQVVEFSRLKPVEDSNAGFLVAAFDKAQLIGQFVVALQDRFSPSEPSLTKLTSQIAVLEMSNADLSRVYKSLYETREKDGIPALAQRLTEQEKSLKILVETGIAEKVAAELGKLPRDVTIKLEETGLAAAAEKLQVAANHLQAAAGAPQTTKTEEHWLALASLVGKSALRACRASKTEPLMTVWFAEGSADIAPDWEPGKQSEYIKKLRALPKNGKVQRLILVNGYASMTGQSNQNLHLADRRADNVKTRLIQLIYEDDISAKTADDEGPKRLSENGIVIFARGFGEAIDGNGINHPRRVDIIDCPLEPDTRTVETEAESADSVKLVNCEPSKDTPSCG